MLVCSSQEKSGIEVYWRPLSKGASALVFFSRRSDMPYRYMTSLKMLNYTPGVYEVSVQKHTNCSDEALRHLIVYTTSLSLRCMMFFRRSLCPSWRTAQTLSCPSIHLVWSCGTSILQLNGGKRRGLVASVRSWEGQSSIDMLMRSTPLWCFDSDCFWKGNELCTQGPLANQMCLDWFLFLKKI